MMREIVTPISPHKIFWFAIMVVSLTIGTAAAAPMTLSGTVSCREPMALPATAVVEVKLLDVSRADAPALTLAETRIAEARQAPIHYTLSFDTAQIEPRRSYALQARILDGDRLLFISTARHAVFAGDKDEGKIVVEHVAGKAEVPVQLSHVGRWLAEDIRGGGVIDRLQSMLEIDSDGAVTGSGGCNRIRGNATIMAEHMTFGQMISTRMACTPAVMDQESKFLSALNDSRTFRIDARQRRLFLFDAEGRMVMRLSAM